MLCNSWKAGALALAALCIAAGEAAGAQTPLVNNVQTVAGPTQGVPLQYTVSISLAGTYYVTLTDLGAALTPSAPLASVELGITSGSSIVGTPLTAAGTTSFSATPGNYVLHVIGTPGAVAGSGPVGITIANAQHTVIDTYSGTLALPASAVPQNEGVLAGTFTVPSSGTYQLTLTDLALPQALSTLTLAITVQGGGLVAPSPFSAGTTPVPLQSGTTYAIFAVGQATGTPVAGLYGVTITPSGGGTPVYSQAVPVGAVALVASPDLSGGNYTFKLADLAYPNALSQLGGVVTLNGQAVVTPLMMAGTAGFTATANTYQVFALALPSTTGSGNTVGTGSYAVSLLPASGPAALSVARAVSASGNPVSAYSFDAELQSAGTYALELADFGFPSPFVSISAAAVQGGALIGSALKGVGSENITTSAAPISFLVFAQAGTSGSLFGIDLAPASGSPVFQTTQAVGSLFSVVTLPIVNAGTYGVTVSDVGFPTSLASLAVVVTQGTNHIGSIYTAGTFTFAASPGDYLINFIAQPGGAQDAGTYALTVAASPIVMLSSSAMAVSSGSTVALTWSSQNASSCAASGGWSGTQPTSGTMTSAALTTTTTFNLECTGIGGSTTQSVKVVVAAASGGGGGGGGSLDPELLLLLCCAVLLRVTAWWRLPQH